MEALSAFISIVSIIAIVLVVGGLVAFIGHMIIGAFDGNKQAPKTENKEVLDYSQYKQLEDSKQAAYNAEYDFEAINESKAEKEKSLSDKDAKDIFELEEDKDEDLEAIENRLKSAAQEEVEEPAVKEDVEEDIDDFNLDEMLSEISDEVIEEEKAETETEVKMSDELESYSIDEMLKQAESDETTETEDDLTDEFDLESIINEVNEESLRETEEVVEELPEEVSEIVEEQESQIVEEVTPEVVESVEEEKVAEKTNSEVEDLKAQLAELNRQLELARTSKVEVVKIDVTEEECVQKIEVLEERLKNVKKDYKINMKEYRPLKKVMNDLERYQTKLRRKEAIVAKKKVALYGVNNYVDIDKEKAEKLANELELLDGLRLSVNHCEEVINANKDRFPILEHANQILEDQIAHLETDLAQAQETLKKIREKNGNGEGNNEGNV